MVNQLTTVVGSVAYLCFPAASVSLQLYPLLASVASVAVTTVTVRLNGLNDLNSLNGPESLPLPAADLCGPLRLPFVRRSHALSLDVFRVVSRTDRPSIISRSTTATTTATRYLCIPRFLFLFLSRLFLSSPFPFMLVN